MINVNIIGYKQFQDSLKKMPSTLRKEVGTRVRAASEQFRDLAIKDAPADVGFLRSQITVKPIDELKYEVVSGSKYSAPMEFGTILDWVKRKGIGGKYRGSIAAGKVTLSKKKQDTLVKTAEAIAWSILKNGVKPHPFFFKQIPIVRRDLFRKIRNILSQ
jgi:hypothetical protein